MTADMTPDTTAPRGTRWNTRAVVYLALAVAGLVGTWSYNVLAIVEQRDYLGDWFGSGPSVSSLGIDVLVVAVAAIVFMVAEGRRLHLRPTWIVMCIVLVPLVALAFAFPLFLWARERALLAQRNSGTAEGIAG